MLNTHMHIVSPSNNTSNNHHKPYQPYPGKPLPSSSSQPPHSLSQTINLYNQPTHHHYNTNIPHHRYLKGSTPTRLELTSLDMVISATSVTLVRDPLVQQLTMIPLYLTIIGSQVHKCHRGIFHAHFSPVFSTLSPTHLFTSFTLPSFPPCSCVIKLLFDLRLDNYTLHFILILHSHSFIQ